MPTTSTRPLPSRDWEPRFWAKVNKTETCWLWTAATRSDGYGQFRLDGQMRLAHRVVFALTFGEIPAGKTIDHRCLVEACVNPSHLRLATQKQQQENNAGAYKNSASGIRGVSFHKATGRWRARVRHHGADLHLGLFDTAEAAEAAALAKRLELFTFNELDRTAA